MVLPLSRTLQNSKGRRFTVQEMAKGFDRHWTHDAAAQIYRRPFLSKRTVAHVVDYAGISEGKAERSVERHQVTLKK